jgi:hypothetical protein
MSTNMNMSSLREVQQRAYRAIMWDENVVPMAAARLGVYRNNARETFRKSLAVTYPVVQRLVGERCFRGIAEHFMREFPSRGGDLGRFGAELATLLDICYRDTEFAYLADVARLEWACAEAETAAEALPLDLLQLETVAADEHPALRFAMRPPVRFVSSRFPVLRVWEANQSNDVVSVNLAAGAEHVLVTRRAAQVRLHRLDSATFAFARSLADGEPLADAHEAGCAAADDFDARAALVLLAGLDVLASFRSPSHGLD